MTIASTFLLPLVLSYFVVLYSAFSGPIEAGEAY
jgi:cytochrome d ubiquinol oxidase subunit II